jgi:hypothetical protein
MNTVPIEDIAYELRMLLGAAKICQLFDEYNVGNPVNYAKDAVYLHARNLYNFFAADTRNDAKVTQFTQHQFDLTLYRTWIGPLHDHASHIKTSRHTPTNVINGEHLNEQIQKFASDIEKLWDEWSRITPASTLKTQLEEALNDARTQSWDDYDSFKKRLVR